MYKMNMLRAAVTSALVLTCISANAALWSDTSIGYRYGSQFREPFNGQKISKNIVDIQHASGYKYGTNFLNLDILLSDNKDPLTRDAAGNAGSDGAQEFYLVYRNTIALSKVTGKDFAMGGIIRDFGLTVGFDANTKNDYGYNSSKRMLVAGPTVMFDVPGFLNVSLVALWESNAPYSKQFQSQTARYDYDTHPALMAAWGIPFNVGPVALSFEGYTNWIAAKGIDEFNNGTKPEINFDAEVMYDVSPLLDIDANTFKVGVEYQYWRNKFGNDNQRAAQLGGATASTPMIRAEYHF